MSRQSEALDSLFDSLCEEAGVEERQLRQLVAVLMQNSHLVSEGMRARLDDLLPGGSWASVVAVVCDAILDGDVDGQGRVDWVRISARLDEESSARLREVAVAEEGLEPDATPDQVLGDLLQWFERRRQTAERRDTTRRIRESSADAAALLAEKQRQLEQRRLHHGIGSGRPR